MAQKWTSVGAVVTEEQKAEIVKKAQASGMTTNEYIKARLLIDQQEDLVKINNLDKWIIKSIAYVVGHVEAISNKILSPEEYKELEPKIVEIIKRSSFIKDNEIFKNNPEQQ